MPIFRTALLGIIANLPPNSSLTLPALSAKLQRQVIQLMPPALLAPMVTSASRVLHRLLMVVSAETTTSCVLVVTWDALSALTAKRQPMVPHVLLALQESSVHPALLELIAPLAMKHQVAVFHPANSRLLVRSQLVAQTQRIQMQASGLFQVKPLSLIVLLAITAQLVLKHSVLVAKSALKALLRQRQPLLELLEMYWVCSITSPVLQVSLAQLVQPELPQQLVCMLYREPMDPRQHIALLASFATANQSVSSTRCALMVMPTSLEWLPINAQCAQMDPTAIKDSRLFAKLVSIATRQIALNGIRLVPSELSLPPLAPTLQHALSAQVDTPATRRVSLSTPPLLATIASK